jgi:hypothetical protein
MTSTRHSLHSRRTVLRGLGVSIALPWLESVPAFGGEKPKASDGPPLRLGVVFAGNGFHGKEYRASGSGEDMELGRVLEPLKPFRDRLNFVQGLFNAEALKGNIHSSMTGNLLSGAPLASGGEVRSGTSFDQVIAQRHGRATKLPSLVLGCEKANPTVHKNYSMLYSSHISWSSPTTPTPLEVFPALAFDSLFKEGAERGAASVLDSVLEEAKAFRRKVSTGDGQKIDEYLNSVREVERRIENAGERGELQGWRPTAQGPTMPRPADGVPQDIGEHMRLMSDLMVMAFQTDSTRVCTLKLNNDHSSLRFTNLGIDYMIHHLLSHSDTEDWLTVNRFFIEQLARIAGRLDAIDEGGRSALDNTVLMMCSSMLHGASHNAKELPVVLLGGSAAGIEGGRVLDYRDKPHRQMSSLFLSLMDKFGVRLETFGDSETRLAEI